MARKKSNPRVDAAGRPRHGPDSPIDGAASVRDEAPPPAKETPDAPPVAPPGEADDFDDGRRDSGAERPSDSKGRSSETSR